MKKDVYYFSHDANAQDDPKLMKVIDELGMEGYGIFWAIVEKLRNEMEYRLPADVTGSLARRWGTSKEKVDTVIFKYGLFQFETQEDRTPITAQEAVNTNSYFFSARLRRAMQLKSEKARQNVSNRWNRNQSTLSESISSDANDTTAIQPYYEGKTADIRNDTIKGKETKGKETKGKETKGKERQENKIKKEREHIYVDDSIDKEGLPEVLPTPSVKEVVDFFKAHGFNENHGKKAWLYYNTTKWHDRNGNKVTNWKQQMIGSWFKVSWQEDDEYYM